jgi:predicted glutamine amidotransferase
MCEIVAAAWPDARPAGPLLEQARAVERFGIDGFGWGLAWVDPDGRVRGYRSVDSLAADAAGREAAARIESTRFLVHLRRPTLLSTVDLADTQPFVDEAGSFAFVHNGRFEHHEFHRRRYAAVLHGRADSEVGFRVFAHHLPAMGPSQAMTRTLHDLGGYGNVAFLGVDGELIARSGHPLNPFWRFRLDDGIVAATACHSEDHSVFDLVFTGAEEPVRIGPDPERVAPPGWYNATTASTG